MAWKHHTDYRFYIHKHTQGTTTFPKVDVEDMFKCRFMKMSGATVPAVKNVYSEDYAEQDGLRMWVPDPADITYKDSEITITLRWRSDECGDVEEASDNFFNYVTGQKLEWYDTFRNKYWQLILTDTPSVQFEDLHSPLQYKVVDYKFTNYGGRPHTTSQIG